MPNDSNSFNFERFKKRVDAGMSLEKKVEMTFQEEKDLVRDLIVKRVNENRLKELGAVKLRITGINYYFLKLVYQSGLYFKEKKENIYMLDK